MVNSILNKERTKKCHAKFFNDFLSGMGFLYYVIFSEMVLCFHCCECCKCLYNREKREPPSKEPCSFRKDILFDIRLYSCSGTFARGFVQNLLGMAAQENGMQFEAMHSKYIVSWF